MKKFKLLTWAFVAAAVFVTSCTKDDVPTPDAIKNYSGLIVNQGNYTEKNGSLSLYNEVDNSVKNMAYESANKKQALAALVESFVHNGKTGLVICNSPDKIEVVGMDSLQWLATIKGTDVVVPRYGVISGSYAYVTCWGNAEVVGQYPGGYDIYAYPNSYLLKIDMNSKSIVKKIACGGDAEGIALYNGKLYVAVTDGIKVFNTSTDAEEAYVKHTTFFGSAKHIAIDKNGMLWYSVASEGFGEGLAVMNTATNTMEKEMSIQNIDGMSCQIAVTKNKSKVLYFTNEIDASWTPLKSEIYAIDVDTKTVATTPIYSGKQLNGVAVNPVTGNIYTAEIWNYSTNSTLTVLREDGTLLNSKAVGVAASRFIFF